LSAIDLHFEVGSCHIMSLIDRSIGNWKID
jgi:hypothetical protein